MFEITAKKARAMADLVDKEGIAEEIEFFIKRAAESGETKIKYFNNSFEEVGRPYLKGIHQSVHDIRDELQCNGFRVALHLNEEDKGNVYVESIEVMW